MTKGMTGGWNKTGNLLRTLGNGTKWQRAKKKACMKEAHRLRRLMIEAFNAGGPPGKRWKRLSPFTQWLRRIRRKGDGRPLLDTGSLRNSHSVVDVDRDTVFVGIHRTAKRRKRVGGGRSKKKQPPLVDLAALHEHGSDPIYIRVTPLMRWYFKNVLFVKSKGDIKPLKKSTIAIVVRIPARPWVGPIWKAEQDQSARNVMRDTMEGVSTDLGSLLR